VPKITGQEILGFCENRTFITSIGHFRAKFRQEARQFYVFTLLVICPFYVRITVPDSSFSGVQAAGSTRNRPPADAQED
jgi:hypothetical protein